MSSSFVEPWPSQTHPIAFLPHAPDTKIPSRRWRRRDDALSVDQGPDRAGERSEPDDDAALVARVVAGDGRAFGELYDRHFDRVARFVRFRVQSRESAEDLVQEIFVRALRGLPALERPELFGGWLMRIAHNLVCNFWRATSSRPQTLSLDADEDDEPYVIPPASDPMPDVENRLRAEELLDRIAGLTELQQEVLSLRFVAGLSLRETADILGRSENAVKQLQYRAVVELRNRVRPAQARQRTGTGG